MKNIHSTSPITRKHIAKALLISISIAITFFYSIRTHAENKDKSELMALVGMRIPPEVPGKKQGELLGWHTLGGIHVASIKGYGENGYIGNEGGFVIIQLDDDMTRTVLDARVLPLNLLGYDLKDGKLVWRKDAYRKYSVSHCKKSGTDDAIIGIGLMRPERGKEGCLHYSRQVKMAWRVNEKTGKLEDISPKGLSCFYPDGEDECY